MHRKQGFRVMSVFAAGLLVLAACSNGDQSSLLAPKTGAAVLQQAEIEKVEICKIYVMKTSAPPPAATSFHITVGSASKDSVLKPNSCKEVVLSGGADQPVTVTETVPDGFTVSYQQITDIAHVDQPVQGPFNSATASGWVGGSGGPNNAAQGELFVFTNVEEVHTTGCTVTQGYWKTHSSKGPAPYDNAWLNIGALGENTPFYGTGMTWYTVFQTPPKKGNANYILAHQFMAARLNVLGGASTTPAVDAALAASDTYFKTVSNMNNAPSDPVRSTLLGYATTLTSYNEGSIGPGHCN